MWEHRNSDEYEPVRLQLYGLYKVAKEGKCTIPKPEMVRGESNKLGSLRIWRGGVKIKKGGVKPHLNHIFHFQTGFT